MANDYVNFEWEDFEAKYKDVLGEEVMKYLWDNRDPEHCGKVFQFPVMEKFSCVMDVPENHLIHL